VIVTLAVSWEQHTQFEINLIGMMSLEFGIR
jgi:hypothetical protein